MNYFILGFKIQSNLMRLSTAALTESPDRLKRKQHQTPLCQHLPDQKKQKQKKPNFLSSASDGRFLSGGNARGRHGAILGREDAGGGIKGNDSCRSLKGAQATANLYSVYRIMWCHYLAVRGEECAFALRYPSKARWCVQAGVCGELIGLPASARDKKEKQTKNPRPARTALKL